MAQGMQCLHAISNYMRKMELKYQHVLPPPYNTCHIYIIIVCLACTIRLCLMVTAVYYYKGSERKKHMTACILWIPDMTSHSVLLFVM